MIEGIVGMITSYKQVKEEALQYYQELLNVIRDAEMPEEDQSLKILSTQAKNIEEDNFCLMIAGEAKSGKSTFINAYLGTEILPMDVRQCTNSVIEIRYGEDFRLYATYADGRMEDVSGEVSIKEFLTKTASLDDEYRDIPITTINNEVIVKYKDKKISERYIQDLLKGVEKENIHRLTKEKYEQKIRDYIEKMQPNWKEVVVKIEIEYPFEDKDMKGVRIVDSPGVNAAGKVGDVSNEYIKSAQAIMFLRPITGVAIEANSFKEFVESSSMDRNKNAMFLVLTRSASESDETIERAHDEFLNMFADQNDGASHGIAREQIIHADSKAKLYLNTFKTLSTEEIKAEIKRRTADKKIEPFLKAAWYDSDCEKEAFLKELERISNFNTISQSLNQFGRKAHYLELSDFLARMLKVYGKIEATLLEKIDHYNIKMHNPSVLATKLEQLKKELEVIENAMHKEIDDIANKYTTSEGVIANQVEKVMSEYKNTIDRIDGGKEDSFNELEKISFRQIEKFKQFQKEIQEELIAQCNERLKVVLKDKNAVSYVSLEPDFPKDFVEKLKEKSKEEAVEEKDFTSGATFKKTQTILVYSQYNHYKKVKKSIEERMEKIEGQVKGRLHDFVGKLCKAYKKELEQNAEYKKEELKKVEADKREAEEIELFIVKLVSLKKTCKENKEEISQLKDEVDFND